MRIGVVTINPELTSSQRILTAGRERGHEVHLLSLLNFSVSTGDPALLHSGEPLPPLDAAILRLGTQLPGLAVAVGKTLESLGVTLLDPVSSTEHPHGGHGVARTAVTLVNHVVQNTVFLPVPF